MNDTLKSVGSTSGVTPLLEEGAAYAHLTHSGPSAEPQAERFDVIVIGGGQAGLSVGHHLARNGVSFVILDAHARIGDAWRQRWDTLRLFTPARFCGLDGWRFPASPVVSDQGRDGGLPRAYAVRFRLPVRTKMRVDLWCARATAMSHAGGQRFESRQVVITMASYQAPHPHVRGDAGPRDRAASFGRLPPALAAPEGGVLVVGAGVGRRSHGSRAQRPSVGVGKNQGRYRSDGESDRPPHHRADLVPRRLPPAADRGHADRTQGASGSSRGVRR